MGTHHPRLGTPRTPLRRTSHKPPLRQKQTSSKNITDQSQAEAVDQVKAVRGGTGCISPRVVGSAAGAFFAPRTLAPVTLGAHAPSLTTLPKKKKMESG